MPLTKTPNPIELYELISEFQRSALAARAIAETAKRKAEESLQKLDIADSIIHVREHDVASGSVRAYEAAAHRVSQRFGVELPEIGAGVHAPLVA